MIQINKHNKIIVVLKTFTNYKEKFDYFTSRAEAFVYEIFNLFTSR